jgi:hypothetical protein
MLALIVVRASTSPLARGSWLFQPVVRLVSLKASFSGALAVPLVAPALGGVGLVVFAACFLVMRYRAGPTRRELAPPAGRDTG